MPPKFFCGAFMVLLSLSMPTSTLSAVGLPLTPEEFLNKGAEVLVGEIVDVQVLEKNAYAESGRVAVKVIEVFAGNVDTSLLTFSYKRQQGLAMVNLQDWDLVSPPERGKKFIIYFIENGDGTNDLYPQGSNSVQEINSLDDPKVKALRKITGH